MEFDVAIIGCGPVGALVANLLGRRGISTLVVEQAASPHPLPRAVHIDHEMVRLFQDIDLTETILPLMRDTDGHLHVGADGGVIRYMGTAGQARPFGWSNDYFFYQPELEDALRAGLSRFDHVQLRLGCRLTGLEQAGGKVFLTLLEGEVESRVAVRHVIACDGASSPVRKLLGVRPATIVPGPRNLRRWEFMLLPGEDDSEMMRPEQVAGLLEPWVRDVPHKIVRGATYRFHGLVAECWRVGNVFLAGDAAHQTPPFFGQGMCHGFRDVANLAWKLDMVLKGLAPDALLDTYQPEREPHVRSVIGAAVAAGRYICVLDRDKAAERDRTIRAQMAGGPPRTAADLIPAIAAGIVRPGSGQRFIQPQDGEGCLLDDITGGGWRLILRADATLPALPAMWQALGGTVWQVGLDGLTDPQGQLSRWFDANGAAAVLLRPDFYIYGIAADAAGITGLAWDLVRDLVGGVAAAHAA